MRIHRSLLALIAVFALTNVGLATFIAAAPAHLATVTIAAASDDLPTPPPTPVPATTPTPAPIPSTGCAAALVVVPSMNQPTGTQIPGAMKEIGRFALNYSTPAGCPTQSTDSAVVREVSVAFQWSELSAIARRRATVTQLELRSPDRSILYGKYSSVRASGNTTVRFTTRVPRLDIPLAGVKEFVIIGNTTNVTGGNTSAVTLQAHATRVIAELTMSGDVVASSIMYDGAPVAQRTTITAGLDSGSPTGTQTAGTQKEVLRFYVAANNGEATLNSARLKFQYRTNTNTANAVAPIRNITISRLDDSGRSAGPTTINADGTALVSGLNTALIPGQSPRILRVLIDTTQMPIGATLQASLIGLTARYGNDQTINLNPLSPTVNGNELYY